ncbi:MAG: transcriptional repressor [Tannerella sp.]|jgi:Fur family ferric uptake transcriptional regulator|nr:transcriptional repressor [Tannerella sp.]
MNCTHNIEDIIAKLFSEYLKNRKLRHTAERDAIFARICQTKYLFTLDMIWRQLEDDNFHVSRASIYNTIELLLDAKIVVRHQFTSTITQYELKHIAEQHHYSICTSCGAICEIQNEKINNHFSTYKIPRFTAEYYALYFYGICSKCKYKQMRQKIEQQELEQQELTKNK